MVTNEASGYKNKNLSIGDGGALIILETDGDDVLDEHMAKNPRLKDFFEGEWEKYNFENFLEAFTAFYEELKNIGFSDKQKDTIFARAGISGWSGKSKDDKSLLYKQAKQAIKDKQKKSKGTKEEEEEFKRKACFWKDDKLYLEILTGDEQYKFAYLNDGKVEFADTVEDVLPVELPHTKEGDLAFIVKMPDENIANSEVLEPDELLDKVKAHIKEYCDMPDMDIELCSYYVLFTWFYKKTNTVGYLRFIADTGKGKSRMVTVVGDICFYSTSTGGSSSFSGLMRTNERWHGTTVIDEADMAGGKESQVVKYLNAGFEAGKYFILSDKKDPKRQEVFDPFTPKIIGMRDNFRDMATEGRLLSIAAHERTNEDISIILMKKYYEETRKLRNTIARFVLARWHDVDGENMSEFKGMGIEPRLQQLAMPLSIIFQLWNGGEETFKEYISNRQKELKKTRAQSWDGSIFNLVYAIAKGDEELAGEYGLYYNPDGEIEAIIPSMIAKAMNTTPKTATSSLHSIGFEVELRYITQHIQIDEGEGKTKKKRVRAYVVPDGRTWKEITQRYYYSEDDSENTTIEIPEVLKSKKYVDPVPSPVLSVPSVPKDGDEHESGTDGTDGTLNITPTPKDASGYNLVCVCGKRFDTVEVLQHHQANCRDFQVTQSKDARQRLDEERILEEDRSLKTLIRSFVTNASNTDERGAMVVALVNRLAIDRGYEKEEVKAQIDKMVYEEEFMASEDECGEFVKVPES